MKRNALKNALLVGTGLALLAGTAQAAVVVNGDLEIAVPEFSNTNGIDGYGLDAAGNIVINGTTDTGLDVGVWLDTTLSRGFVYSATGGNGGSGGFVNDATSGNGRPRAVAMFAQDNKATTGTLAATIDMNLSEANQFMFVELFGWNAGETSPSLSLAGGTANVTTFNTTETNDADTLQAVVADTATLNSWQTVSLGNIDFGTGYDFYAWRVAILGAGSGAHAFDNLVVVPEPGSLALLGLGGLLITARRRR
ncbi:MAG: PEP-CTERM sorting domain-containing protein [Planctomycetota bacterium]